MSVHTYQGDPRDWGPKQALIELDRLLVLAGWARTGLDPEDLSWELEDLVPTNLAVEDGPFVYKHPLVNEHVWFRAKQRNYLTTANIMASELQLMIGISADGLQPRTVTFLTSQYHQTSWTGQDAYWHVGAFPEGFYITQNNGSYPGGLAVERTSTGVWLTHYIDFQSRYAEATGWDVQLIESGWNVWWRATAGTTSCRAALWQVVDGEVVWLGQASIFDFNNMLDNSGGVFTDEIGGLLRGYWYQRPGYPPVLSELYRVYLNYQSYIEVPKGNSLQLYKVQNTYGTLGGMAWRVQ